jgi:hypothetical protein
MHRTKCFEAGEGSQEGRLAKSAWSSKHSPMESARSIRMEGVPAEDKVLLFTIQNKRLILSSVRSCEIFSNPLYGDIAQRWDLARYRWLPRH